MGSTEWQGNFPPSDAAMSQPGIRDRWGFFHDLLMVDPVYGRDQWGRSSVTELWYPHDGALRRGWAWYAEQVAAKAVAFAMGGRDPFRRSGPQWEEEAPASPADDQMARLDRILAERGSR